MIRLIAVCLCLCAAGLQAKVPVEELSYNTLGAQYTFAWIGQDISLGQEPSYSLCNLGILNYAPVDYFIFSIGAGASRFTIERNTGSRFVGHSSFSPYAAIHILVPVIPSLFKLTTGISFMGISGENGVTSYHAAVWNPNAGALISIRNTVDFEAGIQGHIVDGIRSTGSEKDAVFSNVQKTRGYVSLTIHNRATGGYLSLNGNISPTVNSNWSHGPIESGFGVDIGFILRNDTRTKDLKDSLETFFPSIDQMRKKQDTLAEELE